MLAPHHQRRVELIAYLYCAPGSVSESRIAKDLGYARARIAEDLGIAKKRGLVVQERRFISDRMFEPKRIETLRLVHQGIRLKAHLQKDSNRLRDLLILDSGGEESFPNRLIRMGLAAAPVINDFFTRAACVGIAWGTTLGSIVEGLRGHDRSVRNKHRPIEFVPICGEPLRARKRINSATTLALDLDQIVNGSQENSRSLAGVPALIPERFCKSGDETVIKRFFEMATDYGNIFGVTKASNNAAPQTPVIDQMDMILTSVGTPNDHWKMCDVDLRQEAGGITKPEFSNLVFGDLGGMLMPRPNLDSFEKKRFEFLRQQWTGIRREHYERVAKNGQQQGPPGVVLIAIASNKAEAVYHAIKSNLLNYVLCDHDLAQALADVSGVPAVRDQAHAYVGA